MLFEKRFGNSILGGFKKESVLNYIEKMAEEHEEDLKALESSCEEKLFFINETVKKKQLLCEKYEKEILNLKSKLADSGKRLSFIVNEKQMIIDEKDNIISNMKDRIKYLEIELENMKNIDHEYNKIKKAEYIARERVSQIIKTGKAKILEEYKEQIEHCKEEKKLIRQNAMKEASTIISSAVKRVSDYNTEVQNEVKKLSVNVKQKAKDIIESAKILGEKIFKDYLKLSYEKFGNINFDDFKISEKFDIEYLNSKLDEDIFKASENLKNFDLSTQKDIFKESEKDEKILNKPTKLFLDVVKQKK